MRYFLRAGPGCVVQETSERARFVKGPDQDGPGGMVSYNDAYPDERRWAEQMAGDPNWVEVDRNGEQLLPVPPPPPAPVDDPVDTDTTEPAESE